MQEYLEETVGSCTRRMILYQVSAIYFPAVSYRLTYTRLLDDNHGLM